MVTDGQLCISGWYLFIPANKNRFEFLSLVCRHSFKIFNRISGHFSTHMVWQWQKMLVTNVSDGAVSSHILNIPVYAFVLVNLQRCNKFIIKLTSKFTCKLIADGVNKRVTTLQLYLVMLSVGQYHNYGFELIY